MTGGKTKLRERSMSDTFKEPLIQKKCKTQSLDTTLGGKEQELAQNLTIAAAIVRKAIQYNIKKGTHYSVLFQVVNSKTRSLCRQKK